MAKSYYATITGTFNDEIRSKKISAEKWLLENGSCSIEIDKFAVIDFLCLGEDIMHEDEFLGIDDDGNLCCKDFGNSKSISNIIFIGVQ
jgi:hypothetical protein